MAQKLHLLIGLYRSIGFKVEDAVTIRYKLMGKAFARSARRSSFANQWLQNNGTVTPKVWRLLLRAHEEQKHLLEVSAPTPVSESPHGIRNPVLKGLAELFEVHDKRMELTSTILCPIESVDSSVPMFMKILKNSRWFRRRRAVGFDAPKARSNPTVRRRRNHLEFFKIFMNIGTELSTTLDGTQYRIKKPSAVYVEQRTLGWGSASISVAMGRRVITISTKTGRQKNGCAVADRASDSQSHMVAAAGLGLRQEFSNNESATVAATQERD